MFGLLLKLPANRGMDIFSKHLTMKRPLPSGLPAELANRKKGGQGRTVIGQGGTLERQPILSTALPQW